MKEGYGGGDEGGGRHPEGCVFDHNFFTGGAPQEGMVFNQFVFLAVTPRGSWSVLVWLYHPKWGVFGKNFLLGELPGVCGFRPGLFSDGTPRGWSLTSIFLYSWVPQGGAQNFFGDTPQARRTNSLATPRRGEGGCGREEGEGLRGRGRGVEGRVR